MNFVIDVPSFFFKYENSKLPISCQKSSMSDSVTERENLMRIAIGSTPSPLLCFGIV